MLEQSGSCSARQYLTSTTEHDEGKLKFASVWTFINIIRRRCGISVVLAPPSTNVWSQLLTYTQTETCWITTQQCAGNSILVSTLTSTHIINTGLNRESICNTCMWRVFGSGTDAISLLILLLLEGCSSKNPQGPVISSRIGMKFGRIVLRSKYASIDTNVCAKQLKFSVNLCISNTRH